MNGCNIKNYVEFVGFLKLGIFPLDLDLFYGEKNRSSVTLIPENFIMN